MKLERVATPRSTIGEGPVWDVAEQALYAIDILEKRVSRFDPASGETRNWALPDIVGSMALREAGGAIVALGSGIHTLDFDSGEVAPLALVDDARLQLADGKVDRRGRFVFGTSDRTMKEAIGHVYSLGADRALRRIDDDVILGNGPCWSPDDRTFYHCDSIRQAIYAYEYDIDTGEAANRRLFASTTEFGGIPDGATVDADGLFWIAICEGAKVIAYRPDGTVERVIDMPVKYPSSVMFGGPDLDRLYVTSLNASFLGRPADEQDGATFVLDGLGARGLPEPRYAG